MKVCEREAILLPFDSSMVEALCEGELYVRFYENKLQPHEG